jgi:hypothetical protein
MPFKGRHCLPFFLLILNQLIANDLNNRTLQTFATSVTLFLFLHAIFPCQMSHQTFYKRYFLYDDCKWMESIPKMSLTTGKGEKT